MRVEAWDVAKRMTGRKEEIMRDILARRRIGEQGERKGGGGMKGKGEREEGREEQTDTRRKEKNKKKK